MYNEFKNEFVSDLATLNINFNKEQMSKILAVLDSTANNYAIFNRQSYNNTNIN